MGTSYIDFEDKGFWAKDPMVEAFLLLLFEEIQLQYPDEVEWMCTYKKEIALQSLPLIYGGMSMCFNETIIDDERRGIMLRLIDSIIHKITSDEVYFTGAHLNSLRTTVRNYLVEIKEVSWDEKEIAHQVADGGYQPDMTTTIPYYLKGFSLLKDLIARRLIYDFNTGTNY